MFHLRDCKRWPPWEFQKQGLAPEIENLEVLKDQGTVTDFIRGSSIGQRRYALTVCVLMILVTLGLAPFAQINLSNLPAFLPVYQIAVIGTCLITAYLMHGHYTAIRTTALLHLSAGYLYTAGILTLQLLSFPGIFTGSSRLIGSAQTTTWLWFFWHLGPAVSIFIYAWHEYRHPGLISTNCKNALMQTAVVLAIALGATGLWVTLFESSLPILDMNGDYSRITSSGVAPAIELILAAALIFLWRASRFRNVLHVWLGIVLVALLCDNAITMMGGSRFTVGWYAGRMGSLIAMSVMMIVYMHDIKAAYQRSVRKAGLLTTSNARLDHEVSLHQQYGEALKSDDRRKNEFLALLAHELRNPLAPISAAADLLIHAPLDSLRVRQAGDVIARQVNHMTGMIDDLLDVSRITREVVTLENKPLNLKEILSEAVEQIMPAITAKKHDFSMDMDIASGFIRGDRKRMVQVIANVLINAVKYTPAGGKITLRMEITSAELIVTIADNGIGMAPEFVSRAFQLFSQALRSSERSDGGLGIGLSLVKKLVELHGGSVQVKSKGLGFGSEFLLLLPRHHLPEMKMSSPEKDCIAE